MTPQRTEAILLGLRKGLSRTIAAEAVGIDRETIRNWAARSVSFRGQLAQAEAEGESMLVGIVLGAAAKRLPNTWQAAAWLLERTRPERYGQRARLEVSVDIQEEIRIMAAELGMAPESVSAEVDSFLRSRSMGELRLRNGSVIFADGADDGATRVQGHNLSGAWASEIGLWRHWRQAWEESLRYAVRTGHARIVADGTPKRGHGLVRLLVADESVPKSHMRTLDNIEHLNPAVVEGWLRLYGGTALGRQELEGELIEDVPGAAWQRDWIEASRVMAHPPLLRVVVGVDPATTSSEGADATGIIAAASALVPPDRHEDKPYEHYYVLEDASAKATPAVWGERVVRLYERLGADRIVAETNRGGEMIEHTIHTVNASAAFKGVHATRGKVTRAEPIAALYEQGKVHHVGFFAELEDQMCSYVAGEGASPDQMDALVWALTDLAIKDEPGLLGLYRSALAKQSGSN